MSTIDGDSLSVFCARLAGCNTFTTGTKKREISELFRDAGKSFLPLFVDDKVLQIKSTFFSPFVSPFKHVSGPASNVKRIK